jgi:thiol-disulfide isomerase/thioredoxin
MKTKHLSIPALVLGALITASSCKKEEKSTEQINSVSSSEKILIFDFTASWCPPCGENGTPKLEAMIEKYPGKIVPIAVHANNSLGLAEHPITNDLQDEYEIASIPSFVVGTEKSPGSYNTVEADFNTAKSATPIAAAGIGISKSISGSALNITTKTIFFKELNGKYNLAVYVTEDGVSYNQDRITQPSPFMKVHNHVLRGSANGTWGSEIVSSSTVKNQEIDGTYTFTIPTTVSNKDNLHVVAVLYKMENGEAVSVLNANMQ